MPSECQMNAKSSSRKPSKINNSMTYGQNCYSPRERQSSFFPPLKQCLKRHCPLTGGSFQTFANAPDLEKIIGASRPGLYRSCYRTERLKTGAWEVAHELFRSEMHRLRLSSLRHLP
jgi:hypothetical protein